jgi:hypothetical protein
MVDDRPYWSGHFYRRCSVGSSEIAGDTLTSMLGAPPSERVAPFVRSYWYPRACISNRRAYLPPAATSSAWVPRSMILPADSTMM